MLSQTTVRRFLAKRKVAEMQSLRAMQATQNKLSLEKEEKSYEVKDFCDQISKETPQIIDQVETHSEVKEPESQMLKNVMHADDLDPQKDSMEDKVQINEEILEVNDPAKDQIQTEIECENSELLPNSEIETSDETGNEQFDERAGSEPTENNAPKLIEANIRIEQNIQPSCTQSTNSNATPIENYTASVRQTKYQSRALPSRDRVMLELVETERSYVSYLSCLVEVYLDPILQGWLFFFLLFCKTAHSIENRINEHL